MHETGHSKSVYWNNPERWDEEGGKRGIQDGGHMYPVAALFTIARTWKQPRCPSVDKWIKKLWHIHTMEYYSSIRRSHLNQF